MHDAEYTAKRIPDITVAMSVSNENLLRAQKFVTSLSFYTLNAIETPVLQHIRARDAFPIPVTDAESIRSMIKPTFRSCTAVFNLVSVRER